MNLPHIGEAEIAYSILDQIDKQQSISIDDANLQLSRFLLYLNVNQSPFQLSPSKVCQIRMKNLLKKQLEFGCQLKKLCDELHSSVEMNSLRDELNWEDTLKEDEDGYEGFEERMMEKINV